MSRPHLTPTSGVFLALLVALLTLMPAAFAMEDLGPPVGSVAPDFGVLPDQTGAGRSLKDLVGPKGLVLMFFRSAEWCPYCQAQLMDINSGVANIEERGYRVAGLSYDQTAILAAFTARRDIHYTLLSDPSSTIIDRYGLRDPAYAPGTKPYGVPRPIIFILDRSGVIKAKLYEEGFKTRPPVSAVIAKIDSLAHP